MRPPPQAATPDTGESSEVAGVFVEFETQADEPWAPHGLQGQTVKWSPSLHRPVRVGGFREQAVSTYTIISRCLESGAFNDAAALIEIAELEAEIVILHWAHYQREAVTFLQTRGVNESEIDGTYARLTESRARAGLPALDPERAWFEFRSEIKEFVRRCGTRDAMGAGEQLDRIRTSWRDLHDDGLDRVGALLAAVLDRFGDDAVHQLFLDAEKGNFARRYAQFDVSHRDWEECLGPLLYITFEGGRAHLSGAQRLGDMDFWEEDDRWAWRWNPCGSCGILMQGDATSGAPPRTSPPYAWGVLRGPHDWAWGKADVTPYAVHSFVKLAEVAISELGYPLRVVDCPTTRDDQSTPCQRYVYKTLDAVPDRIYELARAVRPSEYGSARSSDRSRPPAS